MLIRHVPASDEDDSENKEEAKIDLGTPPIVAQDTEALHETMVSQHGLSMFQLLGIGHKFDFPDSVPMISSTTAFSHGTLHAENRCSSPAFLKKV